MACEPGPVIAEEPTTALDVTVQAEILRLVRELQARRGASILFITHDFGVVSRMADRLAVMRRGESSSPAPWSRSSTALATPTPASEKNGHPLRRAKSARNGR